MTKFDTHRELTELVNISESVVYQKLLDERRKYLQSEVNKFVKQQDLIQAYGALCKMEDLSKTMDILKTRISALREEQ